MFISISVYPQFHLYLLRIHVFIHVFYLQSLVRYMVLQHCWWKNCEILKLVYRVSKADFRVIKEIEAACVEQKWCKCLLLNDVIIIDHVLHRRQG